ncbi:hypothetical protein PENTCL1PPCAC_9881 [Pristionchus entomophagus]|uniref:G protein-coupled receptor n=1 Tax=Pristionchus entomophagus TaxID=358040 RepID=A0AAV5SWX8_9BILA|nr:hypothetical protein PENTCL1PPCAC_9881 [Pristionchus entomophagus]
MYSAVDPISEWYTRPLDGDDILAGGSMNLLTLLFVSLYVLVIAVFVSAEKEIIGFRYLISMAVADILCMVQYAFLNGLAILTKSRLFYTDYAWFAYCFHLPLIAWSRFLAIFSPHTFRLQSRRTSFSLCLIVGWIAPLILECATHFHPFITTFYYEPAVYGMVNDNFPKIAIVILVQHRKTLRGASNSLMVVERK